MIGINKCRSVKTLGITLTLLVGSMGGYFIYNQNNNSHNISDNGDPKQDTPQKVIFPAYRQYSKDGALYIRSNYGNQNNLPMDPVYLIETGLVQIPVKITVIVLYFGNESFDAELIVNASTQEVSTMETYNFQIILSSDPTLNIYQREIDFSFTKTTYDNFTISFRLYNHTLSSKINELIDHKTMVVKKIASIETIKSSSIAKKNYYKYGLASSYVWRSDIDSIYTHKMWAEVHEMANQFHLPVTQAITVETNIDHSKYSGQNTSTQIAFQNWLLSNFNINQNYDFEFPITVPQDKLGVFEVASHSYHHLNLKELDDYESESNDFWWEDPSNPYYPSKKQIMGDSQKLADKILTEVFGVDIVTFFTTDSTDKLDAETILGTLPEMDYLAVSTTGMFHKPNKAHFILNSNVVDIGSPYMPDNYQRGEKGLIDEHDDMNYAIYNGLPITRVNHLSRVGSTLDIARILFSNLMGNFGNQVWIASASSLAAYFRDVLSTKSQLNISTSDTTVIFQNDVGRSLEKIPIDINFYATIGSETIQVVTTLVVDISMGASYLNFDRSVPPLSLDPFFDLVSTYLQNKFEI